MVILPIVTPSTRVIGTRTSTVMSGFAGGSALMSTLARSGPSADPQGHLGGSVTSDSSCADGDCVEQERKRSLRVRRRAECIDERRVESLLGETHPLRNNLGGDISLRCHIVGGDTVIVEHRVDAPCDMERLAVGAIVDRLAAEGPSGGEIVSESIEDAVGSGPCMILGDRPITSARSRRVIWL